MLKGFKDFIMRGNVVDLAVGVVIGAAFTAVVTAFTTSFLKPLIKLVGGGKDQFAGQWEISKGNFVDWSGFINAVITFILTAAVLYFLVVFPMNKLAERRRRGEEPPPAAPSEEVKLLTEIRDALVAGAGRRPEQSRLPEQNGLPEQNRVSEQNRAPEQHRVSGQNRGALDNLLGREHPRRTDPGAR